MKKGDIISKKKSLLEERLTKKQLDWAIKNKNHPKVIHLNIAINETAGALYYGCEDARMKAQEKNILEFKKYLEKLKIR